MGWIPEEWEIKQLSDITKINPKKEILDIEKEISFIAMEHISNGGRVLTTNTRKYGEVSKGYTAFKDNDVLLAKITPCFENGKKAVVKNLKNGIGFGSTEFHVLRSKGDTSIPAFLYYYVSTNRFRQQAELNMTGSAGQKRVPTTFLNDNKLAVPPLKEQQKIAQILSTVDSQIDDTDKLIEKTKELKKGLMQRLLSKGIGHKEFKKTEVGEIPVEWEVKSLIDVSDIIMGQSPNSHTYNDLKNGIPFFQGKTEFGTMYPVVRKWCTEPIKISEPFDILISVRAPVGEVNINKYTACIGRGLSAIRATKSNYKFIYYYMQSVKEKLNSSAQGSTFTAINSADLKGINVALPHLQEQTQIANILSSVDTEIEEYQNKKTKLEELKKGLMQQLLTGKVRVV
nr:restriction endonuclease subunit S [Clostridium algidicarnis]